MIAFALACMLYILSEVSVALSLATSTLVLHDVCTLVQCQLLTTTAHRSTHICVYQH
jgi:hypothetical protein